MGRISLDTEEVVYAYAGFQFNGNVSAPDSLGDVTHRAVQDFVYTFVFPSTLGTVTRYRWSYYADTVFPITNAGPTGKRTQLVTGTPSSTVLDASNRYFTIRRNTGTDFITVPSGAWQYLGIPAADLNSVGTANFTIRLSGLGAVDLPVKLVSIRYDLTYDGFGNPILDIPPQRF